MKEMQYVKKLLEMSKQYDVDTIREVNLGKTHRPFEGSPKKHPTDSNLLILIDSPFSAQKKFFEFSLESIGNIEELGTKTSEKGESAYLIRVWIKKGMPALKSEAFIVE